MRIFSKKTLVQFYEIHATAEGSLKAWFSEVDQADWQKPGDVIAHFPTANIITGKRVVFNIKGNSYRLVADVEYSKKFVFIVWIGTHADYDKIDVKTIRYGKGA